MFTQRLPLIIWMEDWGDLPEVTQQSGIEPKATVPHPLGTQEMEEFGVGAKGMPSTSLIQMLGFPPLAMPPHLS